MRANYISYRSPQFRILSDSQVEELHSATLQILERAGVAIDCREAVELLGEAGADVSNPGRVKIPSHLVEQALKTTPKTITLYSRDGEPAMVLNGNTGSHFGTAIDMPEILDPYTKKRRLMYIEDIADMARLCDALPNIERVYSTISNRTIPTTIADKVGLLQAILNTPKPVGCQINDVSSLREMIDMCSIIAGGEEQLKKRPFFMGASEPVSPLTQGKDALEKSLLCAEKGIPNFVYPMPMAGATAPATLPGCVAISNAEVLSQLVVLQLKNPRAPVIIGSIPSIMDMKTTILPLGAPELSVMLIALTELSHYYGLPIIGTAGMTDADIIGIQAAIEATYQILTLTLSGTDLVHNVGLMYHSTVISPELFVLEDEIIDMIKVLMGGMEINNETLPLELIERLGPKATYLTESHTRKHFREFWVPKLFDRSFIKKEGAKDSEELLKQRTIELLEAHEPKPLPEDMVRELR
jgi:trimethylamine--corrinoid protein Co-methyltransferase